MKRRFGTGHLIWALVAGLAGGTAIGLHLHRWCRSWMGGGGDPTARMVERFSRDLKLDAGQKAKLTVILEDTHHRFTELRGEVHPKFAAIRARTDAAIEKILTPEQVVTYRGLRKRNDERRARLLAHPVP